MNYQVNEKNTLFAELAPEEGVLLNLKTKYYFRLNETSQVIWKGLSDGKSMDAIAGEMRENYEVPEEELLQDIQKLTKRLLEEGFLFSKESTPNFSVTGAQESKKNA